MEITTTDDDGEQRMEKHEFEKFISDCDDELRADLLFQSKRHMGVKDLEGQRVMQVEIGLSHMRDFTV